MRTELRVDVVRDERLVKEDVAGRDGERAARRHGVAGIDHQVHDHLFDAARVGVEPAPSGPGEEDELHVLAEDPLEQLAHPREQVIEVDDL